jgi:hypothetical protein
VQFISLARVGSTLSTLPKKARVAKSVKGIPTLSELAKLTDRERRNLANMVSSAHVPTPETPVVSEPKPTPLFYRPSQTRV